MSSKWTHVPFESLMKEPIRNGLTKPSRIRGNGFKMISMGELFDNSIICDIEMDRVPVSEKEMTSLVEENDLLFARQSLVLEGAGKCSIVSEIHEPTVFESHLIRARINERKADPHFVFYYFNSPQGKGRIKSIVEQVSAAGIRGKDLVRLPVPCPDICTQKQSAAILFSIDKKIRLNSLLNDYLAA